MAFPGGSDGKESTSNAGDPGLIPGLGRSPGEGGSNPPWEIPWTTEPGMLQSIESHRVGYDLATKQQICVPRHLFLFPNYDFWLPSKKKVESEEHVISPQSCPH